MELKVGLVNPNAGWEILLSQIGVQYSFFESGQINERMNVPVLIIHDQSIIENHNILEYLNNGGNILCSAKIYSKIFGIKYKTIFVKYLYPETEGIFTDSELIDIHSKIQIIDNSNILSNDGKTKSGYIGKHGKGNVCVLPFDAGQLITDHRSGKKSYFANGRRLPYENVSVVSKGSLRRLICHSLEYLFIQSGNDFVHLSQNPEDFKSIFLFRIDTDYGSMQQIENLYELSIEYNIPLTWFVETKSQKDWLTIYSDLENQEIGLHCHEHEVFSSYADNYLNIKKGIDIMNDAGISPKGFAAPFGKWNDGLAQAVRDLNFEYSSEFSFDYDNLPSETQFSTIQIPVHPICIGSLRRQGYSPDEMVKYFHAQIEKKIYLNEPIVFYHHPTHENYNVVESIFQRINEIGIRSFTFREYSNWWKVRSSIKLSIESENRKLIINPNNYNDYYFRLLNAKGEVAFNKISKEIDVTKLSWEEQKRVLSIPADIEKTRKFNPWMLINKIEDKLFG